MTNRVADCGLLTTGDHQLAYADHCRPFSENRKVSGIRSHEPPAQPLLEMRRPWHQQWADYLLAPPKRQRKRATLDAFVQSRSGA